MSNTITLAEFLSEVRNIVGHRLDPEQEKVVRHGTGPLWVIAGPGSGKTEVLVLRALKLMFVDGVTPRSIVLTTFTEKAAKNLMDRITSYALKITEHHPNLKNIEVEDIRVGTLHGLCNDIMLEHKYPGYENYKLLDDMEQKLFIYEHIDLIKDDEFFNELLRHIRELLESNSLSTNRFREDQYKSWWKRTNLLTILFNRIVEDLVDVDIMRQKGGVWEKLAQTYMDYVHLLEIHKRLDFAHLQKKFLEFLSTEMGRKFVKGDPDNTDAYPGIRHVLVDEYQDTNPIQEKIYFELTKNMPHNLTVVGDDDQALYRFRGGTVDCMVNFGATCVSIWGESPTRVNLNFNYRSHPKIVEYYNAYIHSFDIIKEARVHDKPEVVPKIKIEEEYPAVAYISGDTIDETARNFAEFVRGLLETGIIKDPSQCVLLMRSVRETRRFAGPFANALRSVGIEVYNPRSRTLLEHEEIQLALGVFVSIIDPNRGALGAIRNESIKNRVREWIRTYNQLSLDYPDLKSYVESSIRELSSKPIGADLKVTILEILYRILSHEPFKTWLDDPERSYRLSVLTKLFESYSSIPYRDKPGSNRGMLRMSTREQGAVSFRWRRDFYSALVGYLESEGGLNEPEMDEVIVPEGKFPIMTIHQAKGLEFPIVFVYRLCDAPSPYAATLEELLREFRRDNIYRGFSIRERAEQDMIRLFYVAYSRAKYALIHLVPKEHLRSNNCIGFPGRNREEFKRFSVNIYR